MSGTATVARVRHPGPAAKRSLVQLGRLPLGIRSVAGETLGSYVSRLAARYGAPLAALLTATGLRDRPQDHYPGFGVVLSAEHQELFARRCGLDTTEVQSMLVAAWQSRFGNFHFAPEEATGRELVRAGQAHWVTMYASWVCPDCIREDDGAQQMMWRSPWSFGCQRHGRLMLDLCPECGASLGVSLGKGLPRSARAAAEPLLCQRPSPRDPGSPLAFCSADHSTLKTNQLSVRQSQAVDTFAELWRDNAGRMLGRTVNCATALADARSLAAFVLRFAHTSDLGRLPEWAKDAFDAHSDDRAARLQRQAAAVRDGGGLGSSRDRRDPPHRLSYSKGSPQSSALVAAIAPSVFDILDAPDLETAGSRTAWLVDRIQAGNSGLGAVMRISALTPDVQALLDTRRRGWSSLWHPPAARAGDAQSAVSVGPSELASPGEDPGPATENATLQPVANGVAEVDAGRPTDKAAPHGPFSQVGKKRPRPAVARFDARHVPQVLWQAAWAGLFQAPLAVSSRDVPARQFLSTLLVKTEHQLTWAQAMEALGVPGEVARGAAHGRNNHYVTRSRRQGVQRVLRSRIDALAELLQDPGHRVDYLVRYERYGALQHGELLSPERWNDIVDSLEVHRARRAEQALRDAADPVVHLEERRQDRLGEWRRADTLRRSHLNAEIWLWAELTGRPTQQAPAADTGGGSGQKRQPDHAAFWATYQRFCDRYLPDLREPLREVGDETLAGEPLCPITEHDIASLLAADTLRPAA